MKRIVYITTLTLMGVACRNSQSESDAYGNFEAVETIVSAEATGSLQHFAVEEGQTLRPGQVVGLIDTTQLYLRKAQLLASKQAVTNRTPNVAAQISYYDQQLAVQAQQLKNLRREQERSQNLLTAGAAPAKQLDDVVNQIAVLERQMALTRQQRAAQASALGTQRSGTQAETAPIMQQIEQLNDQIRKSRVVNPLAGTVTVKLAEPAEVVTFGKPLYKIADLQSITLRAYVSGDQLVRVKPGQKVQVRVDAPDDQYHTHEGTVQWISSKAEFTPKVIQTKEERVNLVYAMKVRVKNDGSLKIGMPGEVQF